MTEECLDLANQIRERIDRYENITYFIRTDHNRPHWLRKKSYFLGRYNVKNKEIQLDGNDVMIILLRNEEKIKVLKYLLETLTDDNVYDYRIELKNLVDIGTRVSLLKEALEYEENKTMKQVTY